MKIISVDIRPMVNVLYQEWHNEVEEDNRKPLNRKENIERIINKIVSLIDETFNKEYVNKIKVNKKDRTATIELVDTVDSKLINETCDILTQKELHSYYNIV